MFCGSRVGNRNFQHNIFCNHLNNLLVGSLNIRCSRHIRTKFYQQMDMLANSSSIVPYTPSNNPSTYYTRFPPHIFPLLQYNPLSSPMPNLWTHQKVRQIKEFSTKKFIVKIILSVIIITTRCRKPPKISIKINKQFQGKRKKKC